MNSISRIEQGNNNIINNSHDNNFMITDNLNEFPNTNYIYNCDSNNFINRNDNSSYLISSPESKNLNTQKLLDSKYEYTHIQKICRLFLGNKNEYNMTNDIYIQISTPQTCYLQKVMINIPDNLRLW